MGRESSIFGADGGQLKVEDYRCVCVCGGVQGEKAILSMLMEDSTQ